MEAGVPYFMDHFRATSKLCMVNSHVCSLSRYVQSENRPLKLKSSCLMTTADKKKFYTVVAY